MTVVLSCLISDDHCPRNRWQFELSTMGHVLVEVQAFALVVLHKYTSKNRMRELVYVADCILSNEQV